MGTTQSESLPKNSRAEMCVSSDSITFLRTERDLLSSHGIDAVVRLFTLSGLGVNQEQVLRDCREVLADLSWDWYDVRREQNALIREHVPDLSADENKILDQYYRGKTGLTEVRPLIERLSAEFQHEILNLKPYRKRAMTKAHCELKESGVWSISAQHDTNVTQDVGSDDYRSIERVYPRLPEEFFGGAQTQELISRIATIVRSINPSVTKLALNVWLSSTVATLTSGGTAKNTPEGVHQDGADYIVSAIVVDRRNVEGGVSNIYGPDKKTKLFSHTLQPGEGIFQADQHSPLWHDASPIQVQSSLANGSEGVRSLIGIDVKVLGS